ncbi:MAG TPA: nuclear transport factor 2 family protein [Cyclobacteriaceae bacterium]
MTTTNQQIIETFYTAFGKRDYATMQSLYHDDATFSDPVFQNLNSSEVKAMWQMLLTNAKDINVIFSEVKTADQTGSCRWDAYYTFTQTGRMVHNIVHAQFTFKDGRILIHRDHFNFWRWTRLALGFKGLLLGWSSLVQNKVRATAQGRLKKFMSGAQ